MPRLSDLLALIRDAQSPEFWVVAALGLVLGAILLWWAFRHLEHKRLIEDTPTALVRSAPQGYIELQGQAALMDGDPIHAPLSMRLCTWYHFKVERREKRRSGSDRSGWRTIERGTSDHLFYLVDGTGRCAIDPDGATVTASHRNVWYGRTRVPGRYHTDDGAWWARALGQVGQPYRYTEQRIEPGDDIYTLGNFTTHGTATAFDKEAAVGDLLRAWKRDTAFMLKEFDSDGDGEIGMTEWATARQRAERDILAAREQVTEPPAVDLLSRTGDRRRPFIIAAGTEQQAIARCRRRALTLLLLGLPVTIGTAWAVALRVTG